MSIAALTTPQSNNRKLAVDDTSTSSHMYKISLRIIQIRGVNADEVLVQHPGVPDSTFLNAAHGVTLPNERIVIFTRSMATPDGRDLKLRVCTVNGMRRKKPQKLAKIHIDLETMVKEIERENGQ
jgi:hypothetical protein